MAPATISESASQREALSKLPPPTLYPVRETKFDKYIPPQVDGREKALAAPSGTAAIVIDNGTGMIPSYGSPQLTPFEPKVPLTSGRDGPSSRSHG